MRNLSRGKRRGGNGMALEIKSVETLVGTPVGYA
jgi:hypothetical protein